MAWPFPTLVFSSEPEKEEWNFYHAADQSNQVKRLPGLDVRSTELYMSNPEDGGWLLLRDRDSDQLFLFNLTSLQRIIVPAVDDDLEKFTFLLTHPPSHPDSYLVAVHGYERYWLQFSTGSSGEFTKHVMQEDGYYRGVATTYQRKVIVQSGNDFMYLICPISRTVEIFQIGYKADFYNGPAYIFDTSAMLVEVDGDLFKVSMNCYIDSLHVLQSVDVFKLDLPNREWVRVDDIDGRVFFMGKGFSVACSASAGIKGNRIYFADHTIERRLCCYDLNFGRLTTYLPCLDNSGDYEVPPCWVILNEVDEGKETSCNIQTLDEKKSEITVSDELKEKIVLEDSNNVMPAAPEKTPCLLFTHKNDGNYMLVEPFSKTHRTLHLPQLSPGCILYSSLEDGWTVVLKPMETFFLFNLLTREIIELPNLDGREELYQMTLSSPPTSPDCMLLGLAEPIEDEMIEIIFHRLGDPQWTKLLFPNKGEDPFSPACTNAVFYKGRFFFLDMEGALGVFDHKKQTWDVLEIKFFEDQLPFLISQCFLLESEGRLLSVLMDEYAWPWEVFQLNDEMDGWKKVTDFGDRVLYLGRYASFLRPSPDEESKNSICLQRFTEEDGYEGTTINPWEHDYTVSTHFYESTEYTLNPCWVDVPKSSMPFC